MEDGDEAILPTWFFVQFLGLFTLSTGAFAFEWKTGEKVVVESNENIRDDLYIAAEEIVFNGKVDGDLVVFGKKITVNGVVGGSLIGAGQSVVINGLVEGNVRTGSALLLLGENARVGKDIVSAGAGLDLVKGAVIARDVVFAGAAIRISGKVNRDVRAAGAGLEINGSVGGNVTARVGEATQGSVRSYMSMWDSDGEIPKVKIGITIDPQATITGDLNYTQSKDLAFPSGAIQGEILRKARSLMTSPFEEHESSWGVDFVRLLITMLIVGFFLTLLFSKPLTNLARKLRESPGQSLLWGFVALVAFFFTLIAIFIATVLLAVIFGLLTLKGLAVVVALAGLLTMVVLGFTFVLAIQYLAFVVVGIALGKWLLEKVNLASAQNRFLPMLVGIPLVLLVVELIALVPLVGWFVALCVKLLGLGAIWLKCRDCKGLMQGFKS